MRPLVTGAGGTVGTAVMAALRQSGAEPVAWDRSVAPPADKDAGARLLDEHQPDVVFHLAVASKPTGLDDEGRRVTCEWSRWLTEQCAARGARMLFTSTAMVFSDAAAGPFTVDSTPDAVDGYGGEKLEAEALVADGSPEAVIARLGWQIGAGRGGNQMVEHLAATHEREGRVGASTRWQPACSFLPDTAAALVRLAWNPDAAGVHLIDSNPRWSYYEIASALNALHGGAWRVEANEDFVYDQRMLDDRVDMPPLSDRLALP